MNDLYVYTCINAISERRGKGRYQMKFWNHIWKLVTVIENGSQIEKPQQLIEKK